MRSARTSGAQLCVSGSHSKILLLSPVGTGASAHETSLLHSCCCYLAHGHHPGHSTHSVRISGAQLCVSGSHDRVVLPPVGTGAVVTQACCTPADAAAAASSRVVLYGMYACTAPTRCWPVSARTDRQSLHCGRQLAADQAHDQAVPAVLLCARAPTFSPGVCLQHGASLLHKTWLTLSKLMVWLAWNATKLSHMTVLHRPLLDLMVSIKGGVHFDLVKRVLRDISRSGQAPEEIIQQVCLASHDRQAQLRLTTGSSSPEVLRVGA